MKYDWIIERLDDACGVLTDDNWHTEATTCQSAMHAITALSARVRELEDTMDNVLKHEGTKASISILRRVRARQALGE